VRYVGEHVLTFLVALGVAGVLTTGRQAGLPIPACLVPYVLPFWLTVTVVFGALWWALRRRA
jgi:hypothetical protein